MYQRYRERRRRRRQYNSEHSPRLRMKPTVQILIVLLAVLAVYIILTNGAR
ncbi:MAG TPA: hypothetical protein PKK96_10145 [Anaerolineales bacterium]|nr:hypothetical protein [Anaerolineales bacterium]HMR97627.1 hypothetical protein [Anaerolineales bacterium]HNQ93045.1 hypothetical protein [Anaerolineales bacterium]HNS61350.1 hypothetical protein [Anaerolineales bacterium]